ncbi:MAG TPA: tetratricopeptide repeat protein, partial [Blastocatellia bacterium]|nr:tetratricopeptide repeat protein [Blastocatellia bacterium]
CLRARYCLICEEMKVHQFDQASQSLAIRHNEKAVKLQQHGQIAEAVEYYQKAIKLWPSWATPWRNLGLLRKDRRNWRESLRCFQKAVALDPSEQAAWWNLGIAATALEEWAEARRAWKGFGIDIPEGEGPIEMEIGVTPIRINPYEGAEVVWCRRIDPARAIIDCVPLSQSEHRYGDLLLHDGAPSGFRKLDGKEVPVFDELQLLTPSEYGTFEIIVAGVSPEDVESLTDLADERGLAAEDWSSNLRIICKACSEGSITGKHTHDLGQTTYRHIGFAALSEIQLREILRKWLATKPGARIEEINCLLDPAFTH